MSAVAARLDRVWRDATFEPRPNHIGALVAAEVTVILAEHGIVPTDKQARTLRWLAGWEISTVINLVELMVAGRDVKVKGSW